MAGPGAAGPGLGAGGEGSVRVAPGRGARVSRRGQSVRTQRNDGTETSRSQIAAKNCYQAEFRLGSVAHESAKTNIKD